MSCVYSSPNPVPNWSGYLFSCLSPLQRLSGRFVTLKLSTFRHYFLIHAPRNGVIYRLQIASRSRNPLLARLLPVHANCALPQEQCKNHCVVAFGRSCSCVHCIAASSAHHHTFPQSGRNWGHFPYRDLMRFLRATLRRKSLSYFTAKNATHSRKEVFLIFLWNKTVCVAKSSHTVCVGV